MSLSDVAQVIRGVTYRKEDASRQPGSGLVPILRATNISGSISFNDLVYVPERYVKAEQILRPGDIVLVASSGSRKVVGKSARLNLPWRGSFGAFCLALRPAPEINPRYLSFFLQTRNYRNRISSSANGTNINNMSVDHLRRTPVPLAPRSQQEHIVAEIERHFTRLDSADSSFKRAQAKLKQYRTAVLKEAYEGRLIRSESATQEQEFCGKSDLLELPQNWSWRRVEDVASGDRNSICAGPFGTIFKARDFRPTGIPVIFLRHIKPARYLTDNPTFMDSAKWTDLFQSYSVYGGELLVTKLGDPPGNATIYPRGLGPAMLTPDVIKLQVNEDAADPRYVMHYLNSPTAQRLAFGAAFGTTRMRLTLPIFRTIPIPLPALDEQRLIAAEIEHRLSIASELETSLSLNSLRLESLRSAILERAFQGKLAPLDQQDQSASAPAAWIPKNQFGPDRSGDRVTDTPAQKHALPPQRTIEGELSPYEAMNAIKHSASADRASKTIRTGSQVPRTEDTFTHTLLSASRTALKEDFFCLPRATQIDLAWQGILGLGAIEKDRAIRVVAHWLRGKHLAQFQRIREGGPLYKAIAVALKLGIREGSFDRPKRGYVRALLCNPVDYAPVHWRLCILEALDQEAIPEGDALRAAAEWARETLGLEFIRLRTGGLILRALRSALDQAIQDGEVLREFGMVFRIGTSMS